MLYDFQHQILIGTILGGSSLVKPPKGKNYYLSMRSNNKEWLEYKMQQMPDFFKSSSVHKYGSTYRCNSSCTSDLTNIKNILYSGPDRKITMEILDSLRDIAIAIWFLDGGGKTGRNKKNAYLNTTKFGPKGSKTINQYFNEIDIKCNINHDGKRLKVLFSVDSTISLFKIIAHHFPQFMEYRL